MPNPKKSAGRPKRDAGDGAAFVRLGLDLLPPERDDLHAAAGLSGLSKAAFMRRAVVEASRKVLQEKGL